MVVVVVVVVVVVFAVRCLCAVPCVNIKHLNMFFPLNVVHVIILHSPQNLTKFNHIMNAFFCHQMHLFGEQTLKKEAEWRKILKRPWEAYEKNKRLASPKAMMRPPLPGDPILHQARAASKGKLHVLPQTKDPRMAQFKLTNTGHKELHSKAWTRSLKQIFDFYRKINTVIKKQKVISSATGGDLFEDIDGMNNIITLSDFIKFLSDFKICPQILHKDLVKEIFSVAIRNHGNNNSSSSDKNHSTTALPRPGSASKKSDKHKSDKSSDFKSSLKARPMTAIGQRDKNAKWSLMGASFDAFLDCVARCAIAADISEPTQYLGDVEKIIGFMILLELGEGGDWRKKMRSYGSPPRTSAMIRDSMSKSRTPGWKKKNRIPLVRIGSEGSPARGAGMTAVRASLGK